MPSGQLKILSSLNWFDKNVNGYGSTHVRLVGLGPNQSYGAESNHSMAQIFQFFIGHENSDRSRY